MNNKAKKWLVAGAGTTALFLLFFTGKKAQADEEEEVEQPPVGPPIPVPPVAPPVGPPAQPPVLVPPLPGEVVPPPRQVPEDEKEKEDTAPPVVVPPVAPPTDVVIRPPGSPPGFVPPPIARPPQPVTPVVPVVPPVVTQPPAGPPVFTVPPGFEGDDIIPRPEDIIKPPTPVAPPVTPPVPAQPEQPTALAEDTAQVLSVLLGREKLPNWKRKEPVLGVWQTARGLKSDQKFGPGTALRLAQETGLLPIVRFWPRGAIKERGAVEDYQQALISLAATAEEPRKSQLMAAAEREQGQGFGRTPAPVATTISI